MTVQFESIEISRTDRHGNLEAEIEFYDSADVIQKFGIGECLSALNADDFLKEIGFSEASKYFSDEIQELIDAAVEKALEEKE